MTYPQSQPPVITHPYQLWHMLGLGAHQPHAQDPAYRQCWQWVSAFVPPEGPPQNARTFRQHIIPVGVLGGIALAALLVAVGLDIAAMVSSAKAGKHGHDGTVVMVLLLCVMAMTALGVSSAVRARKNPMSLTLIGFTFCLAASLVTLTVACSLFTSEIDDGDPLVLAMAGTLFVAAFSTGALTKLIMKPVSVPGYMASWRFPQFPGGGSL